MFWGPPPWEPKKSAHWKLGVFWHPLLFGSGKRVPAGNWEFLPFNQKWETTVELQQHSVQLCSVTMALFNKLASESFTKIKLKGTFRKTTIKIRLDLHFQLVFVLIKNEHLLVRWFQFFRKITSMTFSGLEREGIAKKKHAGLEGTLMSVFIYMMRVFLVCGHSIVYIYIY